MILLDYGQFLEEAAFPISYMCTASAAATFVRGALEIPQCCATSAIFLAVDDRVERKLWICLNKFDSVKCNLALSNLHRSFGMGCPYYWRL